jgi:hypothetical protein
MMLMTGERGEVSTSIKLWMLAAESDNPPEGRSRLLISSPRICVAFLGALQSLALEGGVIRLVCLTAACTEVFSTKKRWCLPHLPHLPTVRKIECTAIFSSKERWCSPDSFETRALQSLAPKRG